MVDRPNLLIVTPDQLRADYLGCYGHPFVGTEHIDRLAEEGVRLDRLFTGSPLCGPSRASFMTSTHVTQHQQRFFYGALDARVPNLLTSLRAEGYRLGQFGKDHCFHHEHRDVLYDVCHNVMLGNYDAHPDYERAWSAFELERGHPYDIAPELTERAGEFVADAVDRDDPFCAWINYQEPHPAFTTPEPYFSMFDPDDFDLPENFRREPAPDEPERVTQWRRLSDLAETSDREIREAMAVYCGMIRYVDDQVGALVDRLEGLDVLGETVVLFWSDHGEYLGDFGLSYKLPHFADCLTRVPGILRVPDRYQGRVYEGLTETVDLAPTLLDLAGVDIPISMAGRSLASDLEAGVDDGKPAVWTEAGTGVATPPDAYEGLEPSKHPHFPPHSAGPGAMYRTDEYKLCLYPDDRNELYDLEEDPHETTNRFGDPDYESVRARLTEAFALHHLAHVNRDRVYDPENPFGRPRDLDIGINDPRRYPLAPPCSAEELRRFLEDPPSFEPAKPAWQSRLEE